jgi:hypothetical protein
MESSLLFESLFIMKRFLSTMRTPAHAKHAAAPQSGAAVVSTGTNPSRFGKIVARDWASIDKSLGATPAADHMKKSAFLLLLLTLGATKAFANPVTLTFTGLQNLEAVDTFYDGGAGGDGSVFSGSNYGIVFGSDSLAGISDLDGGTGNFSNVPAPQPSPLCLS